MLCNRHLGIAPRHKEINYRRFGTAYCLFAYGQSTSTGTKPRKKEDFDLNEEDPVTQQCGYVLTFRLLSSGFAHSVVL
jgi:hypothetical protein